MNSILIADDNPQLLDILKIASQKEGYEVFLAEDGQVALEVFRRHQPQIILLDVMMPKLDGFQVCREIRKESNVPIIMITARGEDFEKIMGLEICASIWRIIVLRWMRSAWNLVKEKSICYGHWQMEETEHLPGT